LNNQSLRLLPLYIIQYLYRGIIEGKHFEDEESKAKDEQGNINENYNAKPYSKSLNRVTTGIYYTKISCPFIAFLILLWILL
jgi:hypothetical protein